MILVMEHGGQRPSCSSWASTEASTAFRFAFGAITATWTVNAAAGAGLAVPDSVFAPVTLRGLRPAFFFDLACGFLFLVAFFLTMAEPFRARGRSGVNTMARGSH